MREWMLCASLLLPQIAFVKSKDVGRFIVYELGNRALLLPRPAVSTKLPKALRQTAYYWRMYQNAIARKAFSLIEAIDDAVQMPMTICDRRSDARSKYRESEE